MQHSKFCRQSSHSTLAETPNNQGSALLRLQHAVNAARTPCTIELNCLLQYHILPTASLKPLPPRGCCHVSYGLQQVLPWTVHACLQYSRPLTPWRTRVCLETRNSKLPSAASSYSYFCGRLQSNHAIVSFLFVKEVDDQDANPIPRTGTVTVAQCKAEQ